MSKIGRTPISVPAGVSLTQTDAAVVVKGAKGELTTPIPAGITVTITDGEVSIARAGDDRQDRANHGLVRSLLQNAVLGVSDGYTKSLKLVGTGYRAQLQGQGLQLALGYSHPIAVPAVPGVTFKVENQDTIIISGIDKQVIGQVAADIRSLRPPEPYQGKGIRYSDEVVRRKQGKATAK